MSVKLPYFDWLLRRLDPQHPMLEQAFGRHVHWGYWEDPSCARATAEDYGAAAEALTRQVCAAARVANGQRIIDAGCGFGGTVASLNETLHGVHVTGVNIDARQLERAQRNVHAAPGNTIIFEQGDACALTQPDASVDRVLAVECIFHFPSRATFFAEACRVLRPGGLLALSDFVPRAWYAPIARLGTRSSVMTQLFGHCSLCTLREYRALARRAGLRLVLERDITANTRPTYAFLRALAMQQGTSTTTESLATRAMALNDRAGVIRYTLLAFQKPA